VFGLLNFWLSRRIASTEARSIKKRSSKRLARYRTEREAEIDTMLAVPGAPAPGETPVPLERDDDTNDSPGTNDKEGAR